MEKSAVTCDDEVSFLTHFSDIIYFGFTGERRDGDVLSKNGNKPIFFFPFQHIIMTSSVSKNRTLLMNSHFSATFIHDRLPL